MFKAIFSFMMPFLCFVIFTFWLFLIFRSISLYHDIHKGVYVTKRIHLIIICVKIIQYL